MSRYPVIWVYNEKRQRKYEGLALLEPIFDLVIWLRHWPWMMPCVFATVGAVLLLIGWWKRSRPNRHLWQDEGYVLWLMLGGAIFLLGTILALTIFLIRPISKLL